MDIVEDCLLWIGCAVGFCLGAYLLFAIGFIAMFVIGAKTARGLTKGQAWAEWGREIMGGPGASGAGKPADPPIPAKGTPRGRRRGKKDQAARGKRRG